MGEADVFNTPFVPLRDLSCLSISRGRQMKYDDASWHSDGDFPADLAPEAGATHIGMYVAWLLLQGMAGEELVDDMKDELHALTQRTMTPGQFLLVCDGKFLDDMVNDEANAFTLEYYQACLLYTSPSPRDS